MRHESFNVESALTWLRSRGEYQLAAAVQNDSERDWPVAQVSEGDDVSSRLADAVMIRNLLSLRRLRGDIIDNSMFADPCWDILLDLTAATLEGKLVSVSSLCIAASVPVTTALRTVKGLIDQGIVARQDDPTDRRRTYVSLTDPVYLKMRLWLKQAQKALR